MLLFDPLEVCPRVSEFGRRLQKWLAERVEPFTQNTSRMEDELEWSRIRTGQACCLTGDACGHPHLVNIGRANLTCELTACSPAQRSALSRSYGDRLRGSTGSRVGDWQ